MEKSEFKSYGYKFLSSYEELEHKNVKAVFDISENKKVFITDACALVTVNGLPLSGAAVEATTGIMEDIERVTGISKTQFLRHLNG